VQLSDSMPEFFQKTKETNETMTTDMHNKIFKKIFIVIFPWR
jgi:hypothetical protein